MLILLGFGKRLRQEIEQWTISCTTPVAVMDHLPIIRAVLSLLLLFLKIKDEFLLGNWKYLVSVSSGSFTVINF